MQELIGSKRTSDSLELSKPQPPAKKARVCFDNHKVSSLGTDNKPRNNLPGMPDLVLEKIFSYLSTHDLITCKLLNQRICSLIDKSHLLPLAFWEHTPPSVRACYTREQYESRQRDYLTASGANKLVENFDGMLEECITFSPRLYFDMQQDFITAEEFICEPQLIDQNNSSHASDIIGEGSLCMLLDEYVDKTIHKILVIDISGQYKTFQIKYEAEIRYESICKNGGRIATLLNNGYLELHKLEEGK